MKQTIFQKLITQQNPCDKCGSPMKPIYGDRQDYDRLVCENQKNCGAEIIFPTSTDNTITKRKEPIFIIHFPK